MAYLCGCVSTMRHYDIHTRTTSRNGDGRGSSSPKRATNRIHKILDLFSCFVADDIMWRRRRRTMPNVCTRETDERARARTPATEIRSSENHFFCLDYYCCLSLVSANNCIFAICTIFTIIRKLYFLFFMFTSSHLLPFWIASNWCNSFGVNVNVDR